MFYTYRQGVIFCKQNYRAKHPEGTETIELEEDLPLESIVFEGRGYAKPAEPCYVFDSSIPGWRIDLVELQGRADDALTAALHRVMLLIFPDPVKAQALQDEVVKYRAGIKDLTTAIPDYYTLLWAAMKGLS